MPVRPSSGRRQLRIGKLCRCVALCGLVRRKLSLQLLYCGSLRIGRLNGSELLGRELGIAAEDELGILQTGLVLGDLCIGLIESGLEWAGVDDRKQVALLHGLTLGKQHLLELAVDPCPDRHCVKGLHGTKS